jgi:hypothetical protein
MLRTILGLVLVVSLAAPAFGDEPTAALRIRFGMKDKQGTDWSGTITPSAGKVESIRGWRWSGDDAAEGNARRGSSCPSATTASSPSSRGRPPTRP